MQRQAKLPAVGRLLDLKHRRQQREFRALAPTERLRRFAKLQEDALRLLRQSPAGHRRFLARNHHARRTVCINGEWHAVANLQRPESA